MFPFAFEWIDDMSHYVFMGALYIVLFMLFVILNYCGIRATLDWLCKKGGEHHEGH